MNCLISTTYSAIYQRFRFSLTTSSLHITFLIVLIALSAGVHAAVTGRDRAQLARIGRRVLTNSPWITNTFWRSNASFIASLKSLFLWRDCWEGNRLRLLLGGSAVFLKGCPFAHSRSCCFSPSQPSNTTNTINTTYGRRTGSW